MIVIIFAFSGTSDHEITEQCGDHQSLGFITWEPWMSELDFMAIHPVVVALFHFFNKVVA